MEVIRFFSWLMWDETSSGPVPFGKKGQVTCHVHPRSIRALDGSELCCCYFLNELYELSSPEHGIDDFFPFFCHDCFSQYSYSVLCL